MTYTFCRGDDELELVVEYTCHPESRGRRDSLGVPEEPDEPAWIEIDAIEGGTDITFELTDDEIEALQTCIAERVNEIYHDEDFPP